MPLSQHIFNFYKIFQLIVVKKILNPELFIAISCFERTLMNQNFKDMKDYGTLSQAINKLKLEEGYEYDFNLLDEKLELKNEKETYDVDDFNVDKVLRFEGASNPDDNAILYAISTKNGKKGVLVDGYGISGGQISKNMMNKLDLRQNRSNNERS